MHLTDAEWKVMNAVWERGSATAREILEDLEAETGWAYSTVKTLLTRLHEKGAVSEHKRRNRSLYEPTISQEAARNSAVRSLLHRAFDGTFGSLFHHLVDDQKLSKRDRDALARALTNRKKS